MSDKIDIVRLAGDKIDLCIPRIDDEAIDAYTRWRNDASINTLNAHRVELEVVGDNARAIKCYSKAGFVECGRSHEANYHNGHYCDQVQMEILREDWKNNL